MLSRLTSVYSRLGRFEKILLLLLLLYIGWAVTSPTAGILVLLGFLLYVGLAVELVRLVRRWIGTIIWRLRNRLIVAYVFIAFVPIALIAILAGLSVYILTGGVASYLVSSELERRVENLRNRAHFLALRPARQRAEIMQTNLPLWREQFRNLEILIEDGTQVRYPPESTLASPPRGWKDAHGIVVKDGKLCLWAHSQSETARATLIAALDHDYLSQLVPGLGDAHFLEDVPGSRQPATSDKDARKTMHLEVFVGGQRDRTPPMYNRFDFEISGVAPVRLSYWDDPAAAGGALLVVRTRTSAVLRVVYGQSSSYLGEGWLTALAFTSVVFLVVEIIALIVGVSLTRTITGAVHELYEGTQRVREGVFSHRIAVVGNDQLSELAVSFNHMTEDLERLFVVEKEKERLQSELEIAREVQKQLFPKAMPEVKSVQLAGVCHPARMVSGDYYDFLGFDQQLAVAIGDVAGKGISAALLMAAIQSTMRTQLTAGAAVAVAAGASGSPIPHFSTAHVVSQLNKQLYANTSPEKYATFFFGLYDELTGSLRYTNAGHLPPLILRNGATQPLEVTGTVVGAFPFAKYEERMITLNRGDLLAAYTDGIVEPENEYDEQFGEDRLSELLAKYSNLDSGEIIARIMEQVGNWTGASELQDDMTMVVIRRL